MGLQTSFSAESLLQPSIGRQGSDQLPAFSARHQPFQQQCKAPHQQSSLVFRDETDENRPPLPFNRASMPASLTERVRQQAKTRVSRVKVVRKAANHSGSVQSTSLDFDRLSQPLRNPGHNVFKPSCATGITSAFQLSWPPPLAMSSSDNASQANKCPSFASGLQCPLLC